MNQIGELQSLLVLRPCSPRRDLYAIESLQIFTPTFMENFGKSMFSAIRPKIIQRTCVYPTLREVFVWPSENQKSGASERQKNEKKGGLLDPTSWRGNYDTQLALSPTYKISK